MYDDFSSKRDKHPFHTSRCSPGKESLIRIISCYCYYCLSSRRGLFCSQLLYHNFIPFKAHVTPAGLVRGGLYIYTYQTTSLSPPLLSPLFSSRNNIKYLTNTIPPQTHTKKPIIIHSPAPKPTELTFYTSAPSLPPTTQTPSNQACIIPTRMKALNFISPTLASICYYCITPTNESA